ncbi:MAG: ABC transporter ATP-binding protein [Candidatus Thiothrix putei]|uniref:ABC transporter ATP-binding protein n=1 Tax=Candidatus Thiothrix putei TaxID=3080811 RepID=A0AA95KRX3_9GAMM|nr:MAG: ABC transporter ATP-binding protein [Candidatus Thiothrix putei]
MSTPTLNTTLIHNIITLWRHLGKKRRSQFLLLLIMMLMTMFAEVISIGAVIPFLTALTTPELLFNAEWFKFVVVGLGISSSKQLLLPLTMTFIAAAAFSAGMRILLLWANSRLTVAMGVQLRSELYTLALYQPYEYHAANNSSDLISMTTEKVANVIYSGVLHVLMLVSALVMSIAVIVTLMLVNIWVALVAFAVLGGGYVLMGFLVRQRIEKNSQIIALNQPLAVKCMQEGLGGIRDVIIGGSQPVFSHLYTSVVSRIQTASIQNIFLGSLPKPVLEVIGVTLIVLLAYGLQAYGNQQQAVLPVLGALALGAQRLLPSLQQVYFSWSIIKSSQAVLADVNQYIAQADPLRKPQPLIQPLSFQDAITLQNVSFRYAGTDSWVLRDIELRIPKGARVGFIGETGSGKSTLVDIVMGLLSPTQGQLLVDGVAAERLGMSAWQANIAHVPQSIFLSDTSMTENIAFGVPLAKIDLERVKQAAKQAHIATFIENLPDGYQTLVGERGVRLSGGQRQRIGIARALYKQASVIVFDEATSALDNETEANVMEAIESLSNNLTIIIIAHRLSTLRKCDVIYNIFRGKIEKTSWRT